MVDYKKLSIETLNSVVVQQNYNEPTVDNIFKIYNEIDTDQIFGATDIQIILHCSISTAGALMAKLREMKIVLAVKGNGKGKYRFIYENEYVLKS